MYVGHSSIRNIPNYLGHVLLHASFNQALDLLYLLSGNGRPPSGVSFLGTSSSRALSPRTTHGLVCGS